MSSASTSAATARLDRILADAKRDKEMGYRDKALKMYPHVCGRCAREFAGKRLSELTVHHRDHNHDNNPQDGSNWELLCLYCHGHPQPVCRAGGSAEERLNIDSPPAATGEPV